MMAATVTLTNCNVEIADTNIPESAPEFAIFANIDATKTSVVPNSTETKWVAGDKLNVFYTLSGDEEFTSRYFSIAENDVAAGRFTGKMDAEFSADETYDFYFLYPYSSYVKSPATTGKPADSDSDPYFNVAPKVQTQKGNDNSDHICGSTAPLYGSAMEISGSDTPSVKMHHLNSLIGIKVTNKDASPVAVSNIVFTNSAAQICGTFYVDITGEKPAFVSSGADKYTLKYVTLSVEDGEDIPADGSSIFALTVCPCTLPAGTKLSVKVTTTGGGICTVEKTLDSDLVLEAGKAVSFAVDYKTEAQMTYSTIAEVNAEVAKLAKGAATAEAVNVKNATVMAIDGKNYVLYDGTGVIIYYNAPGASLSLKVGDVVNFSGKATNYYYSPEISDNSSTIEKTDSGEAQHPNPTPIDADAFKATYDAGKLLTLGYFSATGKLGDDGKALTIDGAKTTINLYTAHKDDAGKTVEVTGYPLGISSKGAINFIPVTYKVSGQEDGGDEGDDEGGDGEDVSSIKLLATSGFQSSYSNTEKTFKVDGYEFGYVATIYNAKGSPTGWQSKQVIQMRKSGSGAGSLYNKTSLGKITKVVISVVGGAKAYTLKYGSTSSVADGEFTNETVKPSVVSINYTDNNDKPATGEANVYEFDFSNIKPSYIKLVNGDKAIYISEITIYRED